MIIKKAKQLVEEFRKYQKLQIEQNAELEWANIYRDTVRNRAWLNELAISPGRWAGNYSLVYVIIRILSDYKPLKIIELGLGESSKIISSFLKNELHNSSHIIIEQSQEWIKSFESRFSLSEKSNILNLEMEKKLIKDFWTDGYKDIQLIIKEKFDLYVIDGPFGSDRFSRYDICLLGADLDLGNQFIIIIDDYNRLGEQDTATDLVKLLEDKGIKVYIGTYHGNKSQVVIATEKYKYVTSL